jgi:two-component system response regulator FlrC
MSEGKNILVIDDEEIVRVSCVRILSAEGYNVDAAAFCADGLVMLEENPYDLVLTDFKMPHMDGIELAAHILSRYPEVKIVLFTGYITDETIRIAMKCGVHAFLEKPFTPEKLAETVAEVLGE